MKNTADPYIARSKRIKAAAIAACAGLIVFAALIVIGIVLQESYPALIWIAIGCALAYVVASAAVLLKVTKRMDPPMEEEPPYEIKHPLFKRIMEQYEADGLSDFVNYVSLRGWKLGYVEKLDDSIEFIFLRKERQVGVVLYDGTAEVSVDLQTGEPKETILSMDGFEEPVALWNALINTGRNAARNIEGN